MERVENRVRLGITTAMAEFAWEESRFISAAGNRWQAYLNYLCLLTVRPWLQEIFEGEAVEAVQFCTPGFWEMVNGGAVELRPHDSGTLHPLRLVLLPTEAMDRSELRVPQEWIDLPTFTGDYYLAVEVELDEQWVEFWGYTTHAVIKTEGNWDASDRSYSLGAAHLISDLNVLWVTHQLATEPTRATLSPIASLSPQQTESLIQRLSDRTNVVPRLEVPFEQWGALLADVDALQRLCQARQASPQQDSPIQLSRWLQRLAEAVETGWQSIEALIETDPSPAYGFRQEQPLQELVQRVKLLSLEPGLVLRLLMTLATESDGRVAIRVQILPNVGVAYLPENLRLSLLSDTDQVLQTVQARGQDNVIQLQQFRCAPGTPFRVQVTVPESAADAVPPASWRESFIA